MKNEIIHEIYSKTIKLIGSQVKVDHIADYSSIYMTENKEFKDVKYIIEPVDEFYIYITKEPIAIEIREIKIYDVEKRKKEAVYISKLYYEDNTIILFFEKESLKIKAVSWFSW